MFTSKPGRVQEKENSGVLRDCERAEVTLGVQGGCSGKLISDVRSEA